MTVEPREQNPSVPHMNDIKSKAVVSAACHIQEALPHLIKAADLMAWLEKQDKVPHEANLDLSIQMARVTMDSLRSRLLGFPA